ncbi:putative YopX domain protein [Listeria phage vB_Lino_VEfB7]|nr:putative YopX domain protein [Listeria phage vB_Lino_VEfB7]
MMAAVISINFYKGDIQGEDVFLSYPELGSFNLRGFSEVILMRYTGLRDKLGTKIFEGDIVEVPLEANHGYAGSVGVVTYRNYGLGVMTPQGFFYLEKPELLLVTGDKYTNKVEEGEE